MKGSIRLLSSKLVSQIAAGEVIERPASAVKELVENSLDAEARSITVEIEEGGLRKIRVVDNGHGMSPADAQLAFARHSTSKLRKFEDLLSLQSLGFRGEALASIASIARVVMKTRAEGERLGTQVEIDGGKEVRCEACACEVGTEIMVWGLFQHTPARRKYMKTERTEYGHVFDMVSRLALSNPNVEFRLLRDGQEVFHLIAGQSLKERIRVLFGDQTANALLDLQYHQSNFLISGFVGKPELNRSVSKYQFLFVNGRSVDSRLVSQAVKEAFHSLLMHEKYPWYILDLHLDPALVDVNVHPRKLELRFLNTQEVYRIVFGAVSYALQANILSPVLTQTTRPSASPLGLSFSPSPPSIPSSLLTPSLPLDLKALGLRPVAQIAQSYIVAESEEGFVLIDQHAAHERVRYERLMHAVELKKNLKQALLTPLQLNLGAQGVRLLHEHLEDFRAIGFEIEPFGGHTFLLRSVPQGLTGNDVESLIHDLLEETKNLREALLTLTACRGAIKFGDTLSMSEMEALLRDMEKTKNSSHCPHGRPSMIRFTFNELETLFKRKNF